MDDNFPWSKLGIQQEPEKQRGSYWMTIPNSDIVSAASVMMEFGARLVTMTAQQIPGEKECDLEYHWDVEGNLYTFKTKTQEYKLDSLIGICPAADWAEREIHDYFAVVFEGRESLEPLMLRKSDPPGLFHSNGKEKA